MLSNKKKEANKYDVLSNELQFFTGFKFQLIFIFRNQILKYLF